MEGISEKVLRQKQYRLCIYVLVFLCLFVTLYTILWEINYHDKFGMFQKTEAIITEHVNENNKVYDVYIYNIDGINYQKTTPYESRNQIGDKIKIYYDENNPVGVIYHLDATRIILPIISITMYLVLTGFVILYLITYKHNTMQSNKNSHSKAKK